MAATKYQVLYRYLNEVTNTPITNNSDIEYDEVCEFYQHDHKIMADDDYLKSEAEEEKNSILVDGNSTTNNKTNMLFAYAGTKKIKHMKFVETTKGSGRTADAFVVRDWSQLSRDDIGNRGDFTKKYTTLYAATPEDGGTVVTNPSKYVPTEKEVGDGTPADLGITAGDGDLLVSVSLDSADASKVQICKAFSNGYLMSLITSKTLWALEDNNPLNYLTQTSKEDSKYNSGTSIIKYDNGSYKGWNYTETKYFDPSKNFGIDDLLPESLGPVCTGITSKTLSGKAEYGTEYKAGYPSSATVYNKVSLKMSQIKRVSIPEHYEESPAYPYLIKDTYVRINQDPWFVNCNCGSLEKAIEKAKALADVIGLDNVKVVKLVAIDDFIKLK